jgi:hypothetical protein
MVEGISGYYRLQQKMSDAILRADWRVSQHSLRDGLTPKRKLSRKIRVIFGWIREFPPTLITLVTYSMTKIARAGFIHAGFYSGSWCPIFVSFFCFLSRSILASAEPSIQKKTRGSVGRIPNFISAIDKSSTFKPNRKLSEQQTYFSEVWGKKPFKFDTSSVIGAGTVQCRA